MPTRSVSTGSSCSACRGDDGHHHHLVCTNCGKTVEIESPSESWLKGISDKYGFTIERHTLEVFGLCEDCRKADK